MQRQKIMSKHFRVRVFCHSHMHDSNRCDADTTSFSGNDVDVPLC
jgi:hypothetical protein